MPTRSDLIDADYLVMPADRLQLALLAGNDQDLRRRIQRAGSCAPNLRKRIREAAQVRTLRIRGLRGARVHVMAMPMLLDFGNRNGICPAEVGLFSQQTEVASRMDAWWRSVMGNNAYDVRALSHAVHLEAVLGISPCAVHEFAFFGASLIEGSRTQQARMRLTDRYRRETGAGLLAPYLLMALVTCVGEPEVNLAAWRHDKFATETLLGGMVATAKAQPIVSLSSPAAFFGAINAAQAIQLANTVEWISRQGGAHRLALRHRHDGHVVVDCVYQLPTLQRAQLISWAYDSTWRDLPPIVIETQDAGSLGASRGFGSMADFQGSFLDPGQLH